MYSETAHDMAWEALLGSNDALGSQREANWRLSYPRLEDHFWSCLVKYCELQMVRYQMARKESQSPAAVPWQPLGTLVCVNHLEGFKKAVDFLAVSLAEKCFQSSEPDGTPFPIVTSTMALSTTLSEWHGPYISNDVRILSPPVNDNFKAHYLAYLRFITKETAQPESTELSLVELMALHNFVQGFVYLFRKCRELDVRLDIPPRLLKFLLQPDCKIDSAMAQQIKRSLIMRMNTF